MPHAPQLVRSTLRSRQTPLHSVRLPAHESAQVPPLQTWPAPQAGTMPHRQGPVASHAADMVPGWHTLPWQQPPGQVVALHADAHDVPLQAAAPQDAHAPPPVPHAALVLPGWQTLPWQQPLGHVAASQMKVHWPPTHESAPAQALQVLPPLPHAPFDVPAWHTPPWQHPEGHVDGLQVEPPVH